MSDDELEDCYSDLPWLDEDAEGYAARAKRRRTRILENQLDDVREDLEERLEIHEDLDKEIERERDFKEDKLDRVRKFGSAKDKERKERELRNRIEGLKEEQWKEQVRVWRDSQDLLREARRLNCALTDLKLRLGDLKNYFESER